MHLFEENSPQGEIVQCDLVIDAMGRSGRTATWLASMGYPKPPESRTHIDIAYASRHYHLLPDAFGATKFFLVGPRPDRPRGVMFATQENNRWVLSLQGYKKSNRPPATPQEFYSFARGLPPSEVTSVLDKVEPLDEIKGFRFPVVLRRKYHSQGTRHDDEPSATSATGPPSPRAPRQPQDGNSVRGHDATLPHSGRLVRFVIGFVKLTALSRMRW
ncbi:hypothetical protein [Streptomyces boncukensis]|nr:hypothetical protein [Streptomyces boncukensis]